jgi:hypothetical protein
MYITLLRWIPVNISVTISASIYVLYCIVSLSLGYVWVIKVCACATSFFLSWWAWPINLYRPDLWLYGSQQKQVTTLPGFTQRRFRIYQTSVYWCPSILLPSQPVTTTTRKLGGKEARTASHAEESTSSSNEGRSCNQRLRPAAAVNEVQSRPTTV